MLYLSRLRHTQNGVIQDKIHAAMMNFYASYGLKDRGKKEANFAVTSGNQNVGCFARKLFLDSATDTEYLKQSSFVRDLSTAIGEGILKALDKKIKEIFKMVVFLIGYVSL